MEKGERRKSGQAMVEFLITASVIITMVAILSVLLYAFRQQSGRVINLVASEFP